jgi:8-oxo-dGTP pyrophosphatase MutT (NUDIX family)
MLPFADQKAAVILVTNERNEILMIQEANPKFYGRWFLPGGKSAGDETLIQTALREVREEAGIDVVIEGYFQIDALRHLQQGTHRNRIEFIFKARYKAGTLKTREDIHSIRATWFRIEEIEKLDLRSNLVTVIVQTYQSHYRMIPLNE